MLDCALEARTLLAHWPGQSSLRSKPNRFTNLPSLPHSQAVEADEPAILIG